MRYINDKTKETVDAIPILNPNNIEQRPWLSEVPQHILDQCVGDQWLVYHQTGMIELMSFKEFEDSNYFPNS